MSPFKMQQTVLLDDDKHIIEIYPRFSTITNAYCLAPQHREAKVWPNMV